VKRFILVAAFGIGLFVAPPVALAEDRDVTQETKTVTDAVRVTLTKVGGEHVVNGVSGGSAGARQGCRWTLTFLPGLDDVTYGSSAGPKTHPDAQLALLLCDGLVVQPIWVAPDDVVDLDAAARSEAQRYVEDVLEPGMDVGVNPAAAGLVGLDSWFWVEGFSGQVAAPPISAFGVTIEVRMSAAAVSWDFGDGTVEAGDLGRAYPEESTVRHVHQRDGEYTITATVELAAEYRVDGGAWLALPGLEATASTAHPVQEREAVVTRA
jgi:hypothetical protein